MLQDLKKYKGNSPNYILSDSWLSLIIQEQKLLGINESSWIEFEHSAKTV